MIKPRLLILFISILIALAACNPALLTEETVSENNQVLAVADHNYKMTVADFYHKLANSEFMIKGGILEKDAATYYLDSLLVDTLMGYRADKINLRNHYDYYFRYRENECRILVEAYSREAVLKGLSVDSQEVLEYFEQHKDDFYREEQVFPYHIVIVPYSLKKGKDSLAYKGMTDEKIEEAARELAFDIRSQIDSKETFEEMAKKFSHDEFSARSGGRIEPTIREFYAWPFDSVAFGSKPGEILGPYRDKDGWQILYIDDYVEAGVPPMDQGIYNSCARAVYNEKTRQKSFAIFDTLFNDIKLKYNEELFDTNVYLVEKPIWAAIVNDIDTIDFGELAAGEENIRVTYKVENSTVGMKKELAAFLARRWVIIQEAREMGLDTLTQVVEDAGKIRHYYSRLVVDFSKTDPKWEASEEQMKKYYDEHLSDYEVAKPLNVQHILVKDSVLAEFVADQARSGVDFLQLAEEFYVGEKSVRRDLAVLGYISPEDVDKTFFSEARATRAGEISRPVKTEYGYHVIKVLESKWSTPYENAKRDIKNILKKKNEKEERENFKAGLFEEFNLRKTGRLSPMHFKPKSERTPAA